MLPPQAPPALVSPADQFTRDALTRLAESQAWIQRQHDDLPDPAWGERGRDDLHAELDTYWQASVDDTPDGGSMPRRDALARRLRRIVRDDASLRVSGGLLSSRAFDLIARVTALDAGPLPDVHAGELYVGEVPLTGTLVLWNDSADDDVLVFGTHTGWHTFASFDGLLADVERRLGDDGDPVTVRPGSGDIALRMADGIVDDMRQALDDAWNDTVADPTERIDRLHATLDLRAWIDPYAIVAAYAADVAGGDDDAGRVVRSPPGVAGGAARATGKAGRRLGTVGGRIARVLPGQATRQAGARLPGVSLPTGASTLAHPDTLFPRRFVARDVVVPAGIEPLDGVFSVGGLRFIRQGDDLYGVRFDTSMDAWRLTRPEALDARYSGPLIERLPDGRWQLKRSTGLPGGSGRPVMAAGSTRADDVAALSATQVRALQDHLGVRLGASDGIAFYQRMLRVPVPGQARTRVTAIDLALWHEAVAHARAYVPPTAATANPVIPASVDGLTGAQLRLVQTGLFRRMDFNAGVAVFHQMTHPASSLPGPAITPERIRIWNRVVAEVRAGGRPRGNGVDGGRPLRPNVKVTALANFSERELSELRRLLIADLGNEGREVYRQMAYRATADAPVPLAMQQHVARWDELIAVVLSHREHPSGLGQLLSPDIIGLSNGERRRVRFALKRTLGDEQGKAVYNAMSRRPTLATPPSVTRYQAAVWREALDIARPSPGTGTPVFTMPAGFSLVPESEWPDVVYYYTSRESLETLGDSALVLPQTTLNDDVTAVPLFTAEPDSIPGLLDPIARRWLPPREGTTYAAIGDVSGAWARIELRAAQRDINGASHAFDLYRFGNNTRAFVLRPSAQSIEEGSAARSLWLFDHFSVHMPPFSN